MSSIPAKKRSFDYRSFISFGMLFSFILMSVTGIVLYITPPGRVAKWVTWTFFGLDKEEWQALHTIFSYFFFILGIFHVFSLNWKVIIAYLRKKSIQGINRKKELIASSLVVFFLFFGTLFKVQPLQGIMDIGEYFTESWENKDESAPMPHTEDMTITELSDQVIHLSPELILNKLTDRGIRTGDNKTLKEIGKENKISPFDLYKIISRNEKKKVRSAGSFQAGRGMGRKTLEEIAGISGIDIDRVLSGLKEAGIDASGKDVFRDVAKRGKLTPRELMEKLNQIKSKKEKK